MTTLQRLTRIRQDGARLQAWSRESRTPATVDLLSDEQTVTYKGQSYTASQDQNDWYAQALNNRPPLAKTTRALGNLLSDRCAPYFKP